MFPEHWARMARAGEAERNITRLAMGVGALLHHYRGAHPEHLYIAQVELPGGAAGPVKVGISKDVRARVRDLGLGLPWPLRLLGTVPGVGRPGEQGILRELRVPELHLRGEWHTPEVLRVFAAIPEGCDPRFNGSVVWEEGTAPRRSAPSVGGSGARAAGSRR